MNRDLNLELKALKAEVTQMLNGPEQALQVFWDEYSAHGDREIALNEMLALCGPSAFQAAYSMIYPPYTVPMLDCFDLNLAPLNDDDEGSVQSEESALKFNELARLREESKYPVLVKQRSLRFPYRVPTEDVKVFTLRS